MAKIRCGKPESIPRRGFSTFVNALAFSTLLSSQETDAHLVLNFRSPLGATLLIYRVFLSCQIGGRIEFPICLARFGFPEFPGAITIPALLEWCGTRTRSPRRLSTGGSPGPGAPLGTPSPRGKMNLTGPADLRQIVSGSSPARSHRAANY